MDTIVCPECKKEILILPNLPLMSRRIDSELKKHELEFMSEGLSENEIDRKLSIIRRSLDGQVVETIGKFEVKM